MLLATRVSAIGDNFQKWVHTSLKNMCFSRSFNINVECDGFAAYVEDSESEN